MYNIIGDSAKNLYKTFELFYDFHQIL